MMRCIFLLLFLSFNAVSFADENTIVVKPMTYSVENQPYFSPGISGPGFLVVLIQNNSTTATATIQQWSIKTNISNGKSYFAVIPASNKQAYGKFQLCAPHLELGVKRSSTQKSDCILVVQGMVYDPSLPPLSGSLTVSIESHSNHPAATTFHFALTNQTLLIVGGSFTQLGDVGPMQAQHYPIVQCAVASNNASASCANAITDEKNYANAPINRVATPGLGNGNIYAGGQFNQLGSATVNVGQYLIAKCVLGHCENAIASDPMPYANHPIHSITVGNGFDLIAVGEFSQLGSASVGVGQYLVAKCPLSGNCINYFTSTEPYADGIIYEVRTDNAKNMTYFAGAFHNINGFNSNLTGLDTFLAECISGVCSNAFPVAPNNFANGVIRFADMEDLGNSNFTVYLAGSFNNAAGISVPAGQYLLSKFTAGQWVNFLSSYTIPSANAEVKATGLDGNSNIFIGGGFSQLGDISDVGAGHYLLAKCRTNGSGCVNYLAGNKVPYANGAINSIALGTALSISPSP